MGKQDAKPEHVSSARKGWQASTKRAQASTLWGLSTCGSARACARWGRPRPSQAQQSFRAKQLATHATARSPD